MLTPPLGVLQFAHPFSALHVGRLDGVRCRDVIWEAGGVFTLNLWAKMIHSTMQMDYVYVVSHAAKKMLRMWTLKKLLMILGV